MDKRKPLPRNFKTVINNDMQLAFKVAVQGCYKIKT